MPCYKNHKMFQASSSPALEGVRTTSCRSLGELSVPHQGPSSTPAPWTNTACDAQCHLQPLSATLGTKRGTFQEVRLQPLMSMGKGSLLTLSDSAPDIGSVRLVAKTCSQSSVRCAGLVYPARRWPTGAILPVHERHPQSCGLSFHHASGNTCHDEILRILT